MKVFSKVGGLEMVILHGVSGYAAVSDLAATNTSVLALVAEGGISCSWTHCMV